MTDAAPAPAPKPKAPRFTSRVRRGLTTIYSALDKELFREGSKRTHDDYLRALAWLEHIAAETTASESTDTEDKDQGKLFEENP